jgi:dTDP-4-amino-4,6-dideoxygalactose transaminase
MRVPSHVAPQAPPRQEMQPLITRYRLPEPILVTRPTLPPLEQYHAHLEKIWESRWLTNNGRMHQDFEAGLRRYLGIDHISAFCNGTIALMVALQTLDIADGEVITTPFTFPATAHVLFWNKLTPVFCDIEPRTFNIDPARIEALITPRTKAILPVHVFGNPCDTAAIQEIADRHNLRVIYDAAHAFGVRDQGRPLAGAGDLSVLSFHATKLFSSIEGGAIVSKIFEQKQRVDFLKNFGFADEETIIGPGINGKMNELQAAYGLLQLETIDEDIARRRRITRQYRAELSDVPGLQLPEDMPGVDHNYAYFAIVVDPDAYGMTRNDLYAELKHFNIFTRKYFYPLCSQIPCYQELASSDPARLPVAHHIADRVLCLPIYGTLEEDTVRTITAVLRELGRH